MPITVKCNNFFPVDTQVLAWPLVSLHIVKDFLRLFSTVASDVTTRSARAGFHNRVCDRFVCLFLHFQVSFPLVMFVPQHINKIQSDHTSKEDLLVIILLIINLDISEYLDWMH